MAKADTSNINITVNLTFKRSREEIEFATKETERMHNLIASDKQVEWAKDRIEKIHQMILFPEMEQVKNTVVAALQQPTQSDDGAPAKIAKLS